MGFPGSEGTALVVTSFYTFGSDEIIAVDSVAAVLAGAAPNVTKLTDATWPNQADPIPSGTIKSAPSDTTYILTAGGFFVSPSKSTGSVTIVGVSTKGTVTKQILSTPKNGYFYHEARWEDVNGDGLQD